MQRRACFVTCILTAAVFSHAPAAPLQQVVDDAVRATRAEFSAPELKADQLAVTVIDLRGAPPLHADYRGEARIYPASVVKLCFLAYAHHLLERGELADSPELQRALRDMIVESNNDATATVVDYLTGTTAGPELPLPELAHWHEQRMAVTRWFAERGYANVYAVRKTWAEGPYGREKQDAVVNLPARNFLSTNATARLLREIAEGRCITPDRSAQMLALLARTPTAPSGGGHEEAEGLGFTGPALEPGMKLWSKAGWMSAARHDAALIELPDGGRVIIVTFTEGREHAGNRAIIAAVARRVLAALR
ncbi:MAG: serine hydrolase [Candidatus Didemnitutus sp.]|nr:serine hydrolase [Candidatus Didemnitutus sp.]